MKSEYADLSKEALNIISEAEQKIASEKGCKVALVAYEAQN